MTALMLFQPADKGVMSLCQDKERQMPLRLSEIKVVHITPPLLKCFCQRKTLNHKKKKIQACGLLARAALGVLLLLPESW
jgi:hypothetical protein